MAATFVVVPEWQGSGSSRAMRLVDGADAIRGDLPSTATRVVEVPLEAGDAQGSGVSRMSAVATVRDRLIEELERITGVAIVIGGDCGIELGAVGRVLGQDVALVWFDAHGDLNTPASSATAAFDGMVLRTLLGEGAPQLVPVPPLPTDRLVLIGGRSFDSAEEQYIAEHGIRSIDADDLTPASLIAAVEATGAASVYVHVDLDVLDPGDLAGLDMPEPFGVRATALVEALKALLARFPLAGAGIAGFAPPSAAEAVDDLPTILRIIGALSSVA